MKFTVEREHLLKPLQQVSGPLGGRPTLPILGNLLLQVADGTLSLTGHCQCQLYRTGDHHRLRA